MARVLVAAFVVLFATEAPAGADPAGPSDFRSEVTGFEPAVDGVTAEIRGGDSFIEIDVEPGHEVTVGGYQGDLYLRVLEDGTVQRNRLSSATYLNEDRKGGADIPAEVTAAIEDGAEPDWETVADGGTYAWHDHRVHWMSDVSPQVARGERVTGAYDPWRIPMTVDGTASEIQGFLLYEKTTSPLPWAVVAVAAAGLLAWLGRGRLRVAAAALALISVLAVVVGRADWASTPDGGGNPLLWILPLVALVAAVAATALAERSAGVVLTLASVAALSGWAIFRFQALLKPVLPTDLPFAVDRAGIALALGASVAAAYLAVTSGTFALPSLDLPDDEPE